jgi:hypothetical protein
MSVSVSTLRVHWRGSRRRWDRGNDILMEEIATPGKRHPATKKLNN